MDREQLQAQAATLFLEPSFVPAHADRITEDWLAAFIQQAGGSEDRWNSARLVIRKFGMVPWYVRSSAQQLSSQSGLYESLPVQLRTSIRRVLFAAASDPVLGTGERVSSVSQAKEKVEGSLVAAVAVIKGFSLLLSGAANERVWQAIYEELPLRMRLGYEHATKTALLPASEGLLAALFTRLGFIMQLSTARSEEVMGVQQQLAAGVPIREIGRGLFGATPAQVGVLFVGGSGFRTPRLIEVGRSVANGESDSSWLEFARDIDALRDGNEALYLERVLDRGGELESRARSVVEISNSIRRAPNSWAWLF